MVAREFLAELEKVRDRFEWQLQSDSARAQERRARPRARIRGMAKNLPEGAAFEPIGALCYAQTGRAFAPDAWIDAANALQLSLIDAGDLTAAANDRTWMEVNGRRQPNPYMQKLRKRLADAVGLQVE